MKESIKVGCIGCGSRGRLYSSLISKIPGFEMWAYADKLEEKTSACLDEYGGSYATRDVGKVITDSSIGAVFICTHHDMHHLFAVEAAQNHKHILIEKPMAMTIGDCQDIEDEVNKAGVVLAVGLSMKINFTFS